MTSTETNTTSGATGNKSGGNHTAPSNISVPGNQTGAGNNTSGAPQPQPKVKVKPGETLRFSNGSFKIFSHKCMYINRISKRELEKMKNHGDGKPTVGTDTTINGIKVQN